MATLNPTLSRLMTARRRGPTRPWIEESHLRGGAAQAVLLAQILGAVGLAWDIQWHISVGRDTFLTPPHVLLYTSVGLTGLICLGLVLTDTWRFHYGQAVDEGNSVRVLGLFRAPLGFVMAGFGALTTAMAAPLDNYWHELYGIDVALWAPFHTLGSLGGFIGTLGMLYAWASLMKSQRSGTDGRLAAPGLGFLATLMLLVGTASVQARPALFNSPTLDVGPIEIALYPVLLGLFVPWLFVLARCVLDRRSGPALLLGLWTAFTAGLMVLVPWLVQTGAAAQGLPMRGPDPGTGFRLLSLLMIGALWLVGAASTPALWRLPTEAMPSRLGLVLAGSVVGPVIWLVGAALATFAADQLRLVAGSGLPIASHGASLGSLLLALPFTLLGAMASMAIGAGLAQVLRRSPR
jgi:hypothetical protein